MKTDLNKIFLCAVLVLFLLIAGGTVVAFLTKKAEPGKGLRKDDPAPEQISSVLKKKHVSAFTKIGQLRSSTAPDEKDRRCVVVVTPWLEYNGNDESFCEELDVKLRSIRAIVTQYFMDYTVDQLLSRGESRVKADLLSRINDGLVLGKVSAIYFNEYQFLD